MVELGKACVQIIPSTRGISGSITQALGGEATSAGQSTGKSLGLNIVSALKGVVAAAGLGTIFKSALDAGGALQQSYGGLETIYGEAATAAKKYATEAAKAGISANDYAEQTVSFGASLRQAYGGDTVAAVEAANTAILDMADNSAKMGTDITSIQNAYQGFAKQNYTMLDNLKLGYGGTKKEMERLLEDATKLSGIEYDIDNLGDVYDAIHVIQQDLGLTGVAAAEASSTFTGSMGAMKAAAQNLLANLALGEDIISPLTTLVGNAKVFLTNNLLPMVKNILLGVPKIFNEVTTNILPELMNEGMSLVKSLGEGMVTGIPEFVGKAMPILTELSANLRANAGQLIDCGLNFLENVAQGIATALPDFITSLPDIVSNLAGIIHDNMPKIYETGWNILSTLGEGIMNGLPQIVESIPQLVQAFLDVWRAKNGWFMECGMDTLTNIVDGILSAIPTIIEMAGEVITTFVSTVLNNLPQVLESGMKIILYVVNGIVNNLPKIVESVVKVITKFIATITANLPQILQQGIIIIAKLVAGLLNAIPQVVAAIPQIVAAIKNGFESIDWGSVGRNLISGIASGISAGASMVIDAAKNAAESAFSAAKSFLGINSPAKKGIWMGDMYDQGIALGIDRNTDKIKNATDEMMEEAFGALTTPQANFNLAPSNQSKGNITINMTVNAAKGMDEKAVAEMVIERVNNSIYSMESAYA